MFNLGKLKPRKFTVEKERLFEEAMKEKITANFLKDENVKLRTRIHILEGDVIKKEKVIDELLQQLEVQSTFPLGQFQQFAGLKAI